ncbi:MAG: aminopeptidase P N-terminal domain-containing protein [Bacteroidota bacterium]
MADPIARYQPIDASLFIQNRKKLAEKLLPNSLVVLHANDIMPTNEDGVVPFKQNSDFFYLTGIDQEESIVLLYPDAPDPSQRSLLFVKKTSPTIALWEGDKYTLEGAAHTSGISNVYWLEEFPRLLHRLMGKVDYVYLNSNEHARAEVIVETRNARFIKWCQAHYPLHQYKRLAPIMSYLRATKSAAELALIRQACMITRDGFLEMLPCVRPGVMEYALEASLSRSFLERGSRGFAYSPIVASGARANILHYIANSQACQAGDLILLDVGAEYACYNADMTRVVPVSGHFNQRQKEVYQAVLCVMETAKKLLRPGISLAKYHQEVGKVMTEELLQLGLLTSAEVAQADPHSPPYKRYFMHGTSHHLGLGVHDWVDMDRALEAGMVLTVEPGIYIPEEGIGIRLENNIHILDNGVEDLMADIPLTVEAIEEAMQAV